MNNLDIIYIYIFSSILNILIKLIIIIFFNFFNSVEVNNDRAPDFNNNTTLLFINGKKWFFNDQK